MGSAPSIPREKKVVIVGGGYGGTKVAMALKKQNSNYTIIDVHDSMYHNVASVRAVVQHDFTKSLFIPYEKTFGEHFKQGKVTGVKPDMKKVVLESGEEIEYDVLVIATGSTTFSPFKKNVDSPDLQGITQLCNETVVKLKNSKEVVIIGGGAVGCEVAGELKTDLKDVNVTIIQSANFLVTDTLGQKFQKNLQQKLQKMGVNLVLGEKVSEGLEDSGVYGPCQVVTDKGNRFNADVVIRCTGGKVNSQAYATSLSGVTNENGSLQVNEYLQVTGHTDIFAIGDCTDVKEMKLAYRVGEQVPILLHNISALYKQTKLKQYDPSSPSFGIGLSIGRNNGVLVKSNGGLLPDFLITSLKSKKLMVPNTWSDMQQKLPKF